MSSGATKASQEKINQQILRDTVTQEEIQIKDFRHLIEQTTQTMMNNIIIKITVKHAFDLESLSIEGDLTALQKILVNLIFMATSTQMGWGLNVSVTTGVVNAHSECLSECLSRQNFGEGNYVYVETINSFTDTKHFRPEIFYPYYTIHGFRGYCLAFPTIQGTHEDYHGVLRLATSDAGENTRFRMFIPIKQNMSDV